MATRPSGHGPRSRSFASTTDTRPSTDTRFSTRTTRIAAIITIVAGVILAVGGTTTLEATKGEPSAGRSPDTALRRVRR